MCTPAIIFVRRPLTWDGIHSVIGDDESSKEEVGLFILSQDALLFLCSLFNYSQTIQVKKDVKQAAFFSSGWNRLGHLLL